MRGIFHQQICQHQTSHHRVSKNPRSVIDLAQYTSPISINRYSLFLIYTQVVLSYTTTTSLCGILIEKLKLQQDSALRLNHELDVKRDETWSTSAGLKPLHLLFLCYAKKVCTPQNSNFTRQRVFFLKKRTKCRFLLSS